LINSLLVAFLMDTNVEWRLVRRSWQDSWSKSICLLRARLAGTRRDRYSRDFASGLMQFVIQERVVFANTCCFWLLKPLALRNISSFASSFQWYVGGSRQFCTIWGIHPLWTCVRFPFLRQGLFAGRQIVPGCWIVEVFGSTLVVVVSERQRIKRPYHRDVKREYRCRGRQHYTTWLMTAQKTPPTILSTSALLSPLWYALIRRPGCSIVRGEWQTSAKTMLCSMSVLLL